MSDTVYPRRNLPPRRQTHYEDLGLVSGQDNSIGEEELKEKMTHYLRQGPIKALARIFHQHTCPGDWLEATNASLTTVMQAYYQNGAAAEYWTQTASTLLATIRFRWESCLLADQIVGLIGLPVPENTICAMWDQQQWAQVRGQGFMVWQWMGTFQEMCGGRAELLPRLGNQGGEFRRPWLYVLAALWEWDKSDAEVAGATQRIMRHLAAVRRFNHMSVGRVLPPRGNDTVPR
ncbi:hypothetical protein PDE_04814 [Penicillium oxalicum 114-2]|uniref:Uncharacterized protein n=1 Tax=Penicillium oxalicum (strain 114-2 / CGMCC 5302) TaxID=933388 RepID=S7ZHY7_PENO1|nr:hypothetical protein PDE_04814 [Penicillium oxalicum 114-2]